MLEDELGGGAALEQGAAVVGVEPIILNGVTRNGLDRSGSLVLSDLSERDDIVSLLFETGEGRGIEPHPSSTTGSFAILRVDEVAVSAPRPLAEVRGEVRSALVREAEREAAERVASALADRVRVGEDLAAAAPRCGPSP